MVSQGRANGDSAHFHAVRFYRDAETLGRIVAEFLGSGLAAGQPAIVIATPAHVAAIEHRLGESGLDIDGLKSTGDLMALDAAATLAQFMVDGMPDSARFRRTLTPVIEAAVGGRPHCRTWAYGEMVDLLWKAGQNAAALRLESLWDVLARAQAVSLLCGYATGNAYQGAAVDDICSHHSHVISEWGQPAIVN